MLFFLIFPPNINLVRYVKIALFNGLLVSISECIYLSYLNTSVYLFCYMYVLSSAKLSSRLHSSKGFGVHVYSLYLYNIRSQSFES